MIISLIWNWYEVFEGIFVSLIFVSIPIIFHAEKRHRTREEESNKRHEEQMISHKKIQEYLGINQ